MLWWENIKYLLKGQRETIISGYKEINLLMKNLENILVTNKERKAKRSLTKLA